MMTIRALLVMKLAKRYHIKPVRINRYLIRRRRIAMRNKKNSKKSKDSGIWKKSSLSRKLSPKLRRPQASKIWMS
jgi:hypothetical protein